MENTVSETDALLAFTIKISHSELICYCLERIYFCRERFAFAMSEFALPWLEFAFAVSEMLLP